MGRQVFWIILVLTPFVLVGVTDPLLQLFSDGDNLDVVTIVDRNGKKFLWEHVHPNLGGLSMNSEMVESVRLSLAAALVQIHKIADARTEVDAVLTENPRNEEALRLLRTIAVLSR